MNVAIIGGGLTGLTAAYYLAKSGHKVTVLEKESQLGGLASGFRNTTWKWHLESTYHHLFTNDRHIISLLHTLGLKDKLIFKRPITASLWEGNMYQLDSPIHLLRFPGLSPVDKFRTAILLGFLKCFPFWRVLENITAEQLLTSIGGIRSYKTIWEPLLYGKFGTLAPEVAASWFWARIVKRTPRLCYIEGGFHTLIETLAKEIKHNGGKIITGISIDSVRGKSGILNQEARKTGQKTHDSVFTIQNATFDNVLLTVPSSYATKMVPALPKSYTQNLLTIPHLFAQTIILETERPLLKNVYWLNVTDRSFPFLAAVSHTNFMDSKFYGKKHLTYFGNYLPEGHPYLTMTKRQLLNTFLPYIQKLSPAIDHELSTMNSYMFTTPFAQPVHQRHYSRGIPPIQTPIPGMYMANMDYIFPWDRGINYAVNLGIQAAKEMLHP